MQEQKKKKKKKKKKKCEFVYRICKSRGKYFLYLKVNVV